MNKPTISEDSLEEILEMAIEFPLLIYSDDTAEMPIEVIYIDELGEANALSFPENIVMIQEDGFGNKSVAIYEISDSYKDYSMQYTDPENN